MALMKSPEGDEHEIPDGGVAALEHLGWKRVEQKQAPAKPSRAGKK